MKFEEAVKQLRAGFRVYRKSWPGHMRVVKQNTNAVIALTVADVLAEDWEIIGEQMNFTGSIDTIPTCDEIRWRRVRNAAERHEESIKRARSEGLQHSVDIQPVLGEYLRKNAESRSWEFAKCFVGNLDNEIVEEVSSMLTGYFEKVEPPIEGHDKTLAIERATTFLAALKRILEGQGYEVEELSADPYMRFWLKGEKPAT